MRKGDIDMLSDTLDSKNNRESENTPEVIDGAQPMSLEDALAAAEQATTSFDGFNAAPTAETDAESVHMSIETAAVYNPEMVLADIDSDAPAANASLKDEPVEAALVKPVVKATEKPKTAKNKADKKSAPSVGATAETPPEPTEKPAAPAKKSDKKAKPEAVVEAPPAPDAVKPEKADKKAKPEEEAATAENGKKKKKEKISFEKNFKLLKALIVILALLLTAVSAHVYYHYIIDWSSPFKWTKLIPAIPFAAQVLLLFLSLVTVGTAKRKPIGAAIKANVQEAKEIREAKEIEDNLLVPEVNISTKKTSELSNYQIDTMYKKNLEEISGKLYTSVTKFDDCMRAFESMGATDMELMAVNMAGNAKFAEILDQPRAKTLSASELVTYFLSKPNIYAIKKRGALNWTFKYSSKSFGMIRQNEDSYKVSIKCFPDAAAKLNDKYKALEDSNFPSGPLWFCFNELRNLPPRVCKWIVDTSCQISRFQQIKTDKLKVEKNCSDFDIDLHDIARRYYAGEKVMTYQKFSLVFTKGEDADLTTFLTREAEGLDAKPYTKEYYYKFTKSDDAVSMLCPGKGVSEEMVCTLFDNIEKILKMQ